MKGINKGMKIGKKTIFGRQGHGCIERAPEQEKLRTLLPIRENFCIKTLKSNLA